MKNTTTLPSLFSFVCVLSLCIFVSCGGTEDIETEMTNSLTPIRGDTEEIDIPPDWPNTENTALYIKYYRAQLLKQFGDIPQVHIVVNHERKKKEGMPITQDEFIAYLEALYHLWPSEQTLHTLERHRRLKADKEQVNIINVNTPDEVLIKQLMEQRNLNRKEAEDELEKIREEQKRMQEAAAAEEED